MEFNLEKVSSQNHMGLTASLDTGEKAIIVGWDNGQYILRTEAGTRVQTNNYTWDYDTLADESVMRKNATIAAYLSDESPYKDMDIHLSYDEAYGEWEAVERTSGLHLADISEYDDPDFGGDDDARRRIENDAEYEDALADAKIFIEEVRALDPDDEQLSDPYVELVFEMLDAASSPDIDGFENPKIVEFAETGECDCSHGKTAVLALPAVGAMGIGAMAKGLATKLLPGVAGGTAIHGLRPLISPVTQQVLQQDVVQPEQYVEEIPPMEYDHYSKVEENLTNSFFEFEKEAKGDELTEAMRAQVQTALTAFGPNVSKHWGEDGSNLWYNLMALTQKADTIAELQTVLQSIPDEYHNASPGLPGPTEEAPEPITLPDTGGLVPGGEMESEPAGPSGIPPIGGLDEIDQALAEQSPGGPDGPVGAAPGGGIPGGPGRRASKVAIKKIVTEDLKVSSVDEDSFLDALGVKESYSALPGVQPPTTQPQTPSAVFVPQGTQAQDKARFDQAVQVYLNQGMSYTEAAQRAATDLSSQSVAPTQTVVASLGWKDTSGNPLEKGKVYKMVSASSPVPDFVEVTWVEPENLKIKFAANGIEEEITSDEYEFEPLDEEGVVRTSSVDEDPLAHLMGGSSSDDGPLVDPKLAAKFAGANFSPDQQREFIDEDGVARNLDRLNLTNSHYEDIDDDAILF
jgi:hypothetical protein